MLNRREALLATLALPFAGMVKAEEKPQMIGMDLAKGRDVSAVMTQSEWCAFCQSSPCKKVAKARFYMDAIAAGKMSANDVRAMEGLPRIES
jgi:hypothetical protein